MAAPPPIIVNASTTLVQVDTSAQLGPYIVRLSNLNLPGSMITVRDSTGNASATNTIILSTVNTIKFLNGGGPNNNLYTINQPYGFLTVTPKTSSIWGVVNTFAFPDASQTANLFQINVSTLNVSSFATMQALNASTCAISTVCTNNLFVQGNIVYDQSTIGNVAYYTSTIYAKGDITTQANIYVASTVSTTFVNASSTIYAPFISTFNVNMGGALNTNSTISTAGPLFVGSSISTTGNLAVGASTFIQGQLLAGSLSTLGSASIAGGLSVMSSLYTQGTIFTQSSITAISSISTLNNVNMGGSLSTLGNAFIAKELYVTSSVLATGSISTLQNVNVAGGISTASNLYVGGSVVVAGSFGINNINACTINVLNTVSTISSMAAGGSFNVGGSTIMQGTVSAMSNFNIAGLLSTASSIVGGDSLIIARNGFFGSTVSTASMGVSSLYANTAFISTLSSGQASFYSSLQVQGSVSVFSSLAVDCNVDVGRTLTTSNLRITGSTFISTLAVTNTVGFALNISSSTLHFGLFSTMGAMNIAGLISTTNALTVGSTIDTQYLKVQAGMSVFSNASFTHDIFALSSLFVGLSTLMIGNVTASTNMSTLGVANFGSSVNILGSTIGTTAIFGNTLMTPNIFNSTLQTSTITTSTLRSININTNSEISISSLIQTLYAPSIFNSTLQTSSITTSTLAAINTSTNSLAATSTITQTLFAPTIFNSTLQTSSITTSTLAAINTSTNSLITISSLTQNAFATNIYNSTLQTSSITTSTLAAINTSTNSLTAISSLTQNAYATNIFNSTLQTSSITTSTLAAINTSTNSLITISSLTQNAFATNIFNSTLQTSSITASSITTINETANQITAISTLTQNAFATNIYNSTLQTSSITTSTLAAINTSTNSLTTISSLTQNAFATNIYNSTLQTSTITASTVNTANLSTLGTAAFYSSVQVQGSLSVFSSIAATNINFSGGLFSNGVLFTGGSGSPTFSTMSTVGQAAFYSSVQIQGSVSVFSTLTAYNINFTNTITSNGLPFSGGGGGTLSATSSFGQVSVPLVGSRGLCFDPSGNMYVGDSTKYIIYKITPQGLTSVLAGTYGVSGLVDGIGSTALFGEIWNMTYDSFSGSIMVATVAAIRSVNLVTRQVLTLAGSLTQGNVDGTGAAVRFQAPGGICSDGSGNLYIADINNHNIKKLTFTLPITAGSGVVTTIAGSTVTPAGTAGYINATGASAAFYAPRGIVINSSKTLLWITDSLNHVIRQITLPGIVTTFAGASTPTVAAGYVNSTTPTSVRFNVPHSLAIDASNNLYVVEYTGKYLRFINTSSFYTHTLAGNGTAGNVSGVGGNGTMSGPTAITFDPYGSPWIVTYDSPAIFNYSMSTGYLNLFYQATATAGTPYSLQNTSVSSIVVPGMAAGTIFGSGFTAFNSAVTYISPQGLIMDSQNNLFVSDKFKVRKVAPSGFVTSVFGDPSNIQNTNQPFPGAQGEYNGSYQMCFDNSGNLYIADAGTSTIHVVNTAGTVTNLAPTGQALNNCFGVLFNAGILYVSNTNILASPPAGYLVAINLSTGVSTLIAGSTTLGALTNATGTSARFNYIYGICFDVARANILICDRGNALIRNYVISTGVVTTYSTGVAFPSFIASDTLGNYYATSGTVLYKIVAGSATTFSSGFSYVLGVTVDGYNNIYVSDIVNNCIYFINPAGTSSVYSGTAGASGTQDSVYASSLTVLAPYVGINKSNAQYTLDVGGSLNFTGGLFNNGVIISGGSISTFSTLTASSLNVNILNASTVISQNLTATSGFAKISAGQLPLINSRGVCFDGSGNMFVGDTFKKVIFKITPQGVVSLFAGNYGVAGLVDGIGSAAAFGEIWNMCFDSYSGWIMICTVPVIRAMNPATGQVITLCGSTVQGNSPGTGAAASFQAPMGICSDGAGSLYVADGNSNNICKVSFSLPITVNTGTKLIIAGPTTLPFGASGYYNNATGTSATFNGPRCLVINSAKTLLWVGDFANRVIRQISLTAPYAVTTYAGAVGSSATPGNTTTATAGRVDSTSPGSVQFNGTHGMTIDASNNLFLVDYDGNYFRYINTNTFFTLTLAGNGSSANTEGVGANGQMAGPTAVALDATGSPWIVTSGSISIFNYNLKTGYLSIYWKPPSGNAFSAYSVQNTAISTIAMPGITTANIYGSGFTTFNQEVTYISPNGVQMDSQNNLYIADQSKIRKVTPSGFVTSVYADPSNLQSNNLPGTGALAEFGPTFQMCFDTSGNMFFADLSYYVIYKLNLASQTAIALPISAPTTGLANQGLCMWVPIGIVYNNNTLYVMNRGNTGPYLNSVNLLTNVITLIAGTPGAAGGDVDNATGTSAKFNNPTGTCFDASKNNIFVCDSGNNKIRVISLTSPYAVTTLTPTSGTISLASPGYIVMDSLYNLYVTNYNAPIAVIKIPYGGTYPTQSITYGPSSSFASGFGGIQGITVDSYNYLYVADYTNKLIYRISPTGSTDIYSGLYLVTGTQDSKYASSITLMAPYVGVGTSNPQVALQVVGSNVITPGLYMPTIYPDVFFSVLNYCPYGTSARTMMEIGSTHTGTGGYGSTYKFLVGYSNSAAGVGSYIIQSVSTTNPSIGYNITGTPLTLLTLNNTGLTVNTNIIMDSLFAAGAGLWSGTTIPRAQQGTYIGWNVSGGTGETNFACNKGGGTGGFYFDLHNQDGTFNSRLVTIAGSGTTTITGPGSYGTLKLNTTTTESGVFIRDPSGSDFTGWLLGTSPNIGSAASSTFIIGRYNGGNVGTAFYFASNGVATFPSTVNINGKLNVVGTQLTDGVNAVISDAFLSVFTSVASTTGNRSMIEIGATNTTTGNFGAPYKYLMGFSNVPNGPGGNFIIQSVYSSGNYNNSASTTLLTLNNTGAMLTCTSGSSNSSFATSGPGFDTLVLRMPTGAGGGSTASMIFGGGTSYFGRIGGYDTTAASGGLWCGNLFFQTAYNGALYTRLTLDGLTGNATFAANVTAAASINVNYNNTAGEGIKIYGVGGPYLGLGTFIYVNSGGTSAFEYKFNNLYISDRNGTGVHLDLGGQTWIAHSDEKLKENITPIVNALDFCASLRTVKFSFISQQLSKADKIGFIAQDFVNDHPEVTSRDMNGNLCLGYTDTIPIAVAAIKEQKIIVDAQASTITVLQADNLELRSTITALQAENVELRSTIAAILTQYPLTP